MNAPAGGSALRVHAVGTCGDVVIVHFRSRVDGATVAELFDFIAAHARARGGQVALLDVIEAGTKPPDDEARAHFARGMRSLPLCAAAVVSLGEGFFAALVRSVVTGLAMLARPPFPVEVVRSVDDGCAFLAARVPGVDARALAAEHERVRASI